MKKILLVLGVVLMSVVSMNAQIEQCEIIGRYVDLYEWDDDRETYLNKGSFWANTSLILRYDYYIVEFTDTEKGPSKIWWEFDKKLTDKSDEDVEVYFTRDGRKVIFRYERQDITFFSSWSDVYNRYLKCTVVSKTSKVTGSELTKTNTNKPF